MGGSSVSELKRKKKKKKKKEKKARRKEKNNDVKIWRSKDEPLTNRQTTSKAHL